MCWHLQVHPGQLLGQGRGLSRFRGCQGVRWALKTRNVDATGPDHLDLELDHACDETSSPGSSMCSVQNTLTTKRQYEHQASWSTSTWFALQVQRISVAVHMASAWKISNEMQRSLVGVRL